MAQLASIVLSIRAKPRRWVGGTFLLWLAATVGAEPFVETPPLVTDFVGQLAALPFVGVVLVVVLDQLAKAADAEAARVIAADALAGRRRDEAIRRERDLEIVYASWDALAGLSVAADHRGRDGYRWPDPPPPGYVVSPASVAMLLRTQLYDFFPKLAGLEAAANAVNGVAAEYVELGDRQLEMDEEVLEGLAKAVLEAVTLWHAAVSNDNAFDSLRKVRDDVERIADTLAAGGSWEDTDRSAPASAWEHMCIEAETRQDLQGSISNLGMHIKMSVQQLRTSR